MVICATQSTKGRDCCKCHHVGMQQKNHGLTLAAALCFQDSASEVLGMGWNQWVTIGMGQVPEILEYQGFSEWYSSWSIQSTEYHVAGWYS